MGVKLGSVVGFTAFSSGSAGLDFASVVSWGGGVDDFFSTIFSSSAAGVTPFPLGRFRSVRGSVDDCDDDCGEEGKCGGTR